MRTKASNETMAHAVLLLVKYTADEHDINDITKFVQQVRPRVLVGLGAKWEGPVVKEGLEAS